MPRRKKLKAPKRAPVLKNQWASLKKSLWALFSAIRVAVAQRDVAVAYQGVVQFVRDEPLLITAGVGIVVQWLTGVLPADWVAVAPVLGRFFLYSPGSMDQQRAFDALLDKYVPKEIKAEIRSLDPK